MDIDKGNSCDSADSASSPDWIVELLRRWGRDEFVDAPAVHPMWRRAFTQPGEDEMGALRSSLSELKAGRPEEFQAVDAAFRCPARYDSAVLLTATKRLAEMVDAAMGD